MVNNRIASNSLIPIGLLLAIIRILIDFNNPATKILAIK